MKLVREKGDMLAVIVNSTATRQDVKLIRQAEVPGPLFLHKGKRTRAKGGRRHVAACALWCRDHSLESARVATRAMNVLFIEGNSILPPANSRDEGTLASPANRRTVKLPAGPGKQLEEGGIITLLMEHGLAAIALVEGMVAISSLRRACGTWPEGHGPASNRRSQRIYDVLFSFPQRKKMAAKPAPASPLTHSQKPPLRQWRTPPVLRWIPKTYRAVFSPLFAL